jgi:PAS domain S-box-containing protein
MGKERFAVRRQDVHSQPRPPHTLWPSVPPTDLKAALLQALGRVGLRENEGGPSERAVSEAEKYRIVGEHTYDWELWVAESGGLLYVSPSCERITGYPPEEFIEDQTLLDRIVHPDDRAEVLRHRREERQEGVGVCHMDFRIVTRDQEIRWISHYCQPVYGKDGCWLGRRVSNRDITGRKDTERALKETQVRYQRLFQESPVSLWEEDFSEVLAFLDRLRKRGVKDFRAYFARRPDVVVHLGSLVNIVDVNRATLDLYGFANLNDLRDGLNSLFCDDSYVLFKEELIALSEGKTCFEGETLTQSLDGKKKNTIVKWSVVPGYETTFSKVIVSVTDVTDLKKLEREKTNILSMFVHDMNSAIVVIRGFLRRLTKPGTMLEREGAEKYIRIVDNEASRLKMLVDDFTEFSLLQSGQLQMNLAPISLADELKDVVQTYLEKPPRGGVDLFLHGIHSLPVIHGDSRRIRRVFTNLLDNGFKYSKKGGSINVFASEDGEWVRVQIRDEGIGIDPEDLPHVFELFHRGRGAQSYQGKGVGLATVKAIVEGHGGQVLVDSELGAGTRFTVLLPKMGAALKRHPSAGDRD